MKLLSVNIDLGQISNPAISGATYNASATSAYVGNIERLISVILGTITIVGGVAMLIMLALGALKYITSAGDEKAITEAKKMISNAVLGLIIVVASMTITTILLLIFGIKIEALPWYS